MVVENYKEYIIRKCVITDGEELAEREYKKIKVEGFDNGLEINGYRPPFVTEQVERRYDYDIIITNNQSQFYFENEVNELYDRHINE